jgi:hypothetical protein
VIVGVLASEREPLLELPIAAPLLEAPLEFKRRGVAWIARENVVNLLQRQGILSLVVTRAGAVEQMGNRLPTSHRIDLRSQHRNLWIAVPLGLELADDLPCELLVTFLERFQRRLDSRRDTRRINASIGSFRSVFCSVSANSLAVS